LQSPIILPILHRSPDEHSTDKDGRHHDHDEDENDCSCNVHVEEFACFDHIPGTGCEDIVTAQADTGRASGVLLNRALALECEPIVCRGACLRGHCGRLRHDDSRSGNLPQALESDSVPRPCE
jgi:hypothetical protein